jgi:hypothetical protein
MAIGMASLTGHALPGVVIAEVLGGASPHGDSAAPDAGLEIAAALDAAGHALPHVDGLLDDKR